MSKPNVKPTRNDGGVTTSHRQTLPPAIKPHLTSEDENKIDLSLSNSLSNSGINARWAVTGHIEILIFSKVENTPRMRKALKGKVKETGTLLLIANVEPSEIIRALETAFGRPDANTLVELGRLKKHPATYRLASRYVSV
ncbi:hypothetical protein EVAR_55823_1 [Eumeta japonica]|uniref:Uncharacterized protein n=1 Tax=Eumeta variegata TaxID=151549 RepID=A0A4C1ZDQ4_EUMVA|nr:hypothetical protein EVAR_55823_1 [Eumeta japonica]